MPTAPYDTIETILNATRVRLNDAIQTLGGDILTDNAPFTTQVVNNAYRKMQRALASMGYWTLEDEAIISGLVAIYSPDPAVQVWIDWTGYNNGQTTDAAKFLPSDLIEPLDCWERVATTTEYFADMDLIQGSMPAIPKTSVEQLWTWRANKLYMPGALNDIDIRVRYAKFLADFSDIGADSTQLVPIVQCLDAFSNFICAEMALARGDVDGKGFTDAGMAAAAMIANRNAADSKGAYKVSEFGKMRDGYTPSGGSQ